MHAAAGEQPSRDTHRWRYALRYAIIYADTADASWRDGRLTLLDATDRSSPELIVHRNWAILGRRHPHLAAATGRDLRGVLLNQDDG